MPSQSGIELARKALRGDKPKKKRLRRAISALLADAGGGVDDENRDGGEDDDDDLLAAKVAKTTRLLIPSNGSSNLEETRHAADDDDKGFAAWFVSHLTSTFEDDLEALRQNGPDQVSRLAWSLRSMAEFQDSKLNPAIKESMVHHFRAVKARSTKEPL